MIASTLPVAIEQSGATQRRAVGVGRRVDAAVAMRVNECDVIAVD